MRIGIVGHEASKFTPAGEVEAKLIIRKLLAPEDAILVSGHCHLGGIDIWAEEVAQELGRQMEIYPPKNRRWSPDGYRERNLSIAVRSEFLHCLAVVKLAKTFKGMMFTNCYHCGSSDHVKGGGCWTMKKALLFGRPTLLHKIANED